MFEITPGELLDLIDKGDEIGFRVRGGSVHPSSVSLGIKHGGAHVERRNIKEFLQEFRGGAESGEDSENDGKDSEGEPEDSASPPPVPSSPRQEEDAEDPVVPIEDPVSEEEECQEAEIEDDDEKHVHFDCTERGDNIETTSDDKKSALPLELSEAEDESL